MIPRPLPSRTGVTRMPGESITDLVYQFLRSLVHASFRDGAISGLREAFELPSTEDSDSEVDLPPERNSPGSIEFRAAGHVVEFHRRALPGQVPARRPQQAIPGPAVQGKRGRGRPRKKPPQTPPGPGGTS
jgi:hypothetical protein